MAEDFAGHFKCLNRAINAINTTQPPDQTKLKTIKLVFHTRYLKGHQLYDHLSDGKHYNVFKGHKFEDNFDNYIALDS